mmetsp:Transcript_72875/g.236785  ORF Transcript_72875/g.236785 Transcript_72875/m.236785 type:complete len:575 (-) Transcript_72875:201-1925(-)
MASIQLMMSMDDGARRVDNVGLSGGEGSPAHGMNSLGGSSFHEPMDRNTAETHLISDKRSERQAKGLVPWSTEQHVPDVGGLGWRTKTGHMLKNQSFYPQVTGNTWNNPTFAGVNTWKEFHGPRMRADAEMMERLDQFDGDREEWEAKKCFVNTTRVQTLDRFYNRKHERSQQETSSSWAPHIRAKREVHSSHETFDSTFGEKPSKELKKVFTETVLKGDREAIRNIASRMQNEETWKQVYKQMEQERRSDLRADLQQRQAHTDRLMLLSGQPLCPHHATRSTEVIDSERTHELAGHRELHKPIDVTVLSDFRGLIHADNPHAMEALFPGSGYEHSMEFRARATASCEPGWPAPARAETPPIGKKAQSRELQVRKEVSLSHLSVPASAYRLEAIGGRSHDEALVNHSMSQFLPTVAAPPPDQSASLLNEDWSPSATMRDRARVTGSFARTSTSSVAGSPSNESRPPPRRSMVYPMVAPTSPSAALRVANNGLSRTQSMHMSASAPALFGLTASSTAGFQQQPRKKAKGPHTTKSVCEELDMFEEKARASSVANISNFTSTPRASSQTRQTRRTR